MIELNLNEMECKRVDRKVNDHDHLRVVVFFDDTYEVANDDRWEYLTGIKNYRNQIKTYRFIKESKENRKVA